MKIEFYKYQGSGNDFIILDNRNHQYDFLDANQVKKMCDRKFGIGADGLMLMNAKIYPLSLAFNLCLLFFSLRKDGL